MENEKNSYYLGLDIGTDSVGYAVTDKDYLISKHRGEPMWGVALFDAGKQCNERRAFRSQRRRLDRRQQRVNLLQELFCKEIFKVDPNFFIKLDESFLLKEDKSEKAKSGAVNGYEWNDKKYHREYPTVHHLINSLMNSKEKLDIRFVYIACAWLVAHRGHFLYDIDKENVDGLTDITPIYEKFENWFENIGVELPWKVENISCLSNIISGNGKISEKEKKLKEFFKIGKDEDDDYPISRNIVAKLLAGGKSKANKIFTNDCVADIEINLGNSDSVEKVIAELDDENGELIKVLSEIYDCATLKKILGNEKYISAVKVKEYETHGKDLRELKALMKKYADKEQHRNMFRKSGGKGYADYIGGLDKEEFYKTVKTAIEKFVNVSDDDKKVIDGIKSRIENDVYMPKQVCKENRVIPYQLYYAELKKILENASESYEFLKETDEDGISVSEKILSIFLFRVPYFVGPLNNKSKYAWLERKADKIYPWNFEEMVDLEKSEQNFIENLTNKCTYLPGESVLPKNSILYSKFTVLNEINNIKIDNKPITVELKNRIFKEVFEKKAKVKLKDIISFLISNKYLSKGEEERISGIDIEIKSSLKSYVDFSSYIEDGTLTIDMVENIILHSTCTEDSGRFEKWLKKNYSELNNEAIKRISHKKYADFGRLSEKLLNGLIGTDRRTGECGTVMHFLVNTNDNLMQIIKDNEKYDFGEKIEQIRKDYYSKNTQNINERLEEMGVSNAVKRPILRTLEIISDIVKVKKQAPEKIFVEMARYAGKKERKASRKDSILGLYKEVCDEDIERLKEELEELGDGTRLNREEIYLYFLQLGKCMYCGERIELNDILSGNGKYNVDHIYPRCYVKDDSIANKVLVCSKENAAKGDKLVPHEYREKMYGFWKKLKERNLISEEKLKRLVRNTPFTKDEKLGFINRQIVETGQSTKAVAELLKEKYKESKIVYVKAGCVSDFRHEYGAIKIKAFDMESKLDENQKRDFIYNEQLVKCRSINDIHHANDAYLNIVVGNFYDEKFTKNRFDPDTDWYSLKYPVLFGRSYKSVWEPKKHIPIIDKAMSNSHVHITKYQTEKKGGFYDQNPKAKAENLASLRNGLDTAKYGGYGGLAISFYTIVSYKTGKKKEVTIVPVELICAEKFKRDKNFAMEYVKNILGKKAFDISFVLNDRILKVNTVFSLDGFEVCVSAKTGGSQLVFRNLETPFYPKKYIIYAKNVEKIYEKLLSNKKITISEQFDLVSKSKNLDFYDFLVDKINGLYSKMPGGFISFTEEKRMIFGNLDIANQIKCLHNLILYIKTNRSETCNMEMLEGTKNTGIIILSCNMSNWKYSDIRVVDRSASGLYEKRSENLKELL